MEKPHLRLLKTAISDFAATVAFRENTRSLERLLLADKMKEIGGLRGEMEELDQKQQHKLPSIHTGAALFVFFVRRMLLYSHEELVFFIIKTGSLWMPIQAAADAIRSRREG